MTIKHDLRDDDRVQEVRGSAAVSADIPLFPSGERSMHKRVRPSCLGCHGEEHGRWLPERVTLSVPRQHDEDGLLEAIRLHQPVADADQHE